MSARPLVTIAVIGVAAALAWLLFVALPQRYAPTNAPAMSAPASQPTAAASRRIKVQLFYVGEDGASLNAVEREVPFADQPVEQARAIVIAQLAPTAGLVSAIPAGTTLRALFLTERGEAFVDLSKEVSTAHAGGSTNELLTIYTIVDALTTNLPAINAVQLLVEGLEVETLAGHIDLRRPLTRNLTWVH